VRELKNMIERLIIFSTAQIITAEDINFDHGAENKLPALNKGMDMNELLDNYEKQFILQAYAQGGSVSAGANLLNMKRSTFAAKLKKFSQPQAVT
jgi:DNA-binding NtrC family response regulator